MSCTLAHATIVTPYAITKTARFRRSSSETGIRRNIMEIKTLDGGSRDVEKRL
jgi:hypothetical protein